MIHENIYLNQIEREKSQKKDYQNLRDYGQQFIGKNLQECIPELAKELYGIEIYRGNITFNTYHPRRTKRPKYEICHGFRTNTIPITKDTILPQEFQTIIVKVSVVNGYMFKNKEDKYDFVPTLKFILDDSEEYIINN